jgi:hypothetical protein
MGRIVASYLAIGGLELFNFAMCVISPSFTPLN